MIDVTIHAVNIAVLSFCSLEAFIMMVSFRGETLHYRASRIFFAKLVVAFFTLSCYTVSIIHEPRGRDFLDAVMLSIAYVGVYVIYALYVLYLKAQVDKFTDAVPVPYWVPYFTLVVAIIGSLVWILSIFSDEFSSYRYANSVIPIEIGQIGGLILILTSFIIIIRHYRTLGLRHSLILSSMPVLLAIATFAQPYAHGVDLLYPAIMLEFLIVYTQHHLDVEIRLKNDENAEIRTRLNMATGRMKPHYLYNVLTTIYYLCETDPQKAQNAIGTFSEYLRSTLETMEKQELVSFSWELAEIRNYLTLEKLRFGDRLTVEFDTEYVDFLVPPLSIQPLVENAVKHGISPKEDGGTVRIVSRKLMDGGAQIRVIDNGVGFDVDDLKEMGVTHEGLANVRERIRLEVGGDVTVTSSPGRMTTVVVTIRPDEKGKR